MQKRKSKVNPQFSVIIERDESGLYVATVPSLPSCYTQAKTLPELYRRLDEVIRLSLDVERALFGKQSTPSQFIGAHQFELV